MTPLTPSSLVVVATYGALGPAAADLGAVEAVLRDQTVRAGRGVIVSHDGDGRLRLAGRVRGPRNKLIAAATLVFWVWEPIWLWLCAATALGAWAIRRRRKVSPELEEVLRVAREGGVALVVGVPAKHRAVLEPAFVRADAKRDWVLPISWEDVARQLRIGWVEQERLRRSRKPAR